MELWWSLRFFLICLVPSSIMLLRQLARTTKQKSSFEKFEEASKVLREVSLLMRLRCYIAFLKELPGLIRVQTSVLSVQGRCRNLHLIPTLDGSKQDSQSSTESQAVED